jgi:methylmalonyl-CoA mutase, N-terminal domain
MRDHYGAKSERSHMLRFHTQTAGVSLTAPQPELNLVRTAIEALAGVLGGTQSLHTNSMDEVLALPTEKAARLALRTQQVIAAETGVTNVADPLGGSYYVEHLTDELERQAEAIFAHLAELGNGSILEGVYAGIDNGYFQGEIADAAYSFERRINRGDRITVGVNRYTEAPGDEPLPILVIGPEVEERQRKRLEIVKHDRSDDAVRAALANVRLAAQDSTMNLMPVFIDAAKSYCTLGEIMNTLADVFGRYVEKPVI